jgi:hypothetical protein
MIFVLGKEVVNEQKNSTKNTINHKIPIEDTSVDMKSAAMHNYYYDPNIPPTKSTACIIL